ncbi:hypothetical protein BCV69DRAFT_218332 [Microstroma glucosiphilum]|uniref:Protein OS-9 homolog n=1 Tax=Pseudomicrostroma glucosiphilum TaxID=1684307 RepID=A0A316U483_9BASI|nr:hypothetical protein BCV69DRAFT_218332 [Pseudomicrostroma glucosiphilum]PWN20072.1 hypothetical protein BCV69DRAFT_218332 [Pseudomicrostroma glucosiphilum]
MTRSNLAMVWSTISVSLLVILVIADRASSLRLGKPATTAGLSSATANRFPEDLLAQPAYKVVFEQRTIANTSAQRLLSRSASANGTSSSGDLDLDAVGSGYSLPSGPHHASRHFMMHSSPTSAHLCSLTQPSANITYPSRLALSPANLLAQRHRVINSGLSLLAPLQGTCLYYTLDWFTYSLCFGEAIKQFRAAGKTVGPGRVPTPDPTQDAYVLGRWRDQLQIVGGELYSNALAKAAERADGVPSEERIQELASSLGITREEALSSTLSPSADHRLSDLLDAQDSGSGTELMQVIRFSSTASSPDLEQRYLSQVWSDGTRCDINNEHRSVEVQYHCEPGLATSRIALIKETTTCNYILIVETPLTCKEEQLRVGKDKRTESARMGEWRCRRVVEDGEEGTVESASSTASGNAESIAGQTSSASAQVPPSSGQDGRSEKFFAAGIDEQGNILVEGIEPWEAQLLGMAQDGAAAVDGRDAAALGLGENLEILFGGGLRDGEGGAGMLNMDLGEILGAGEPIELRLDLEDLELLTGQQPRGGGGGGGGPQHDGDFLGLRAEDLQGVIARALEAELNKLKGVKERRADQPPGEQKQNDEDKSNKQASKEQKALNARLDKITEALLAAADKERNAPASTPQEGAQVQKDGTTGSAMAKREEIVQRMAEQRAARVREAQRKTEALLASSAQPGQVEDQKAVGGGGGPGNKVGDSGTQTQTQTQTHAQTAIHSPSNPGAGAGAGAAGQASFAERADEFFRRQEEERKRTKDEKSEKDQHASGTRKDEL